MLGREERFSSECATGKQPPAFHVPSEMWEAGDESAAHTALRGLEEEYSKAHADLLRREHGSNNKPPDRYAGTTPVYASECDISAQAIPHGPTGTPAEVTSVLWFKASDILAATPHPDIPNQWVCTPTFDTATPTPDAPNVAISGLARKVTHDFFGSEGQPPTPKPAAQPTANIPQYDGAGDDSDPDDIESGGDEGPTTEESIRARKELEEAYSKYVQDKYLMLGPRTRTPSGYAPSAKKPAPGPAPARRSDAQTTAPTDSGIDQPASPPPAPRARSQRSQSRPDAQSARASAASKRSNAREKTARAKQDREDERQLQLALRESMREADRAQRKRERADAELESALKASSQGAGPSSEAPAPPRRASNKNGKRPMQPPVQQDDEDEDATVHWCPNPACDPGNWLPCDICTDGACSECHYACKHLKYSGEAGETSDTGGSDASNSGDEGATPRPEAEICINAQCDSAAHKGPLCFACSKSVIRAFIELNKEPVQRSETAMESQPAMQAASDDTPVQSPPPSPPHGPDPDTPKAHEPATTAPRITGASAKRARPGRASKCPRRAAGVSTCSIMSWAACQTCDYGTCADCAYTCKCDSPYKAARPGEDPADPRLTNSSSRALTVVMSATPRPLPQSSAYTQPDPLEQPREGPLLVALTAEEGAVAGRLSSDDPSRLRQHERHMRAAYCRAAAGEGTTSDEDLASLHATSGRWLAVRMRELEGGSNETALESWRRQNMWDKAQCAANEAAAPTAPAPRPDNIVAMDKQRPFPLRTHAPRFANEFNLDSLPDDFIFPDFDCVEFMAHRGEIREAAAAQGLIACSVADRPTSMAVSPKAYHFIGQVGLFVKKYAAQGGSLRFIISHPTCAHMNLASKHTWPSKILQDRIWPAAEAAVWLLHLGCRSILEQPPGAFRDIAGSPQMRLELTDHGSLTHKEWWLWTLSTPEDIPPLGPSNVVPKEDITLTSAISGSTDELRMLKRSATPANLAAAVVKTWLSPELRMLDRNRRPLRGTAQVPRPGFEDALQVARARYGNLSSSHCPTISTQQAATKCVIAVPVSQWKGTTAVRVSLTNDYFGAVLGNYDGKSHEEAVRPLYSFLASDAGPGEVYLAGYTIPADNRQIDAAIFLVPVAVTPTYCITTIEELDRWKSNARSGRVRPSASPSTAWITGSLACLTTSSSIVSMALARIRQLREPAPQSGLRIGIWQKSRPLAKHRSATQWRGLPIKDSAQAEFAEFITAERERGAMLKDAFADVDQGDGRMIEWGGLVMTAHDILGEIVIPPQGLPKFTDPLLLKLPLPLPPLSLESWMFARAPAQQVPPGGEHARPWNMLLKGWARSMICSSFNQTAKHDADTWETGESKLPRPSFLVLGKGAGMAQTHPDGTQFDWNAMNVIWEQRADGLFEPMSFDQMFKDHKLFDFIHEMFYDKSRSEPFTDHELVSFLLHGVRWKIEMPHEIRIAHQLASLDSRYKGVSRSTRKLAEAGLFNARKLIRIDGGHLATTFTKDGPCPLLYIPQASSPVGGADKKGTDEKRKVNAQTAPYANPDGTRPKARNAPHGEPDGDDAYSINELTKVPYDNGELRFAPEKKTTVKDKYAAAAILHPQAHIWLKSFLSGFSDDIRWFFFQFFLEPSQYWHSVSYMILEYDGPSGQSELWFCAISEKVMSMGTSPASQIASRFSEEWVKVFRHIFDKWIDEHWMPNQTSRVQQLYQQRHRDLGAVHARPYWAGSFTDDVDVLTVHPALTARAALIWHTLCKRANLWMCAMRKKQAGTVIEWIGPRYVVNGGYGYISEAKRTRALKAIAQALDGSLERGAARSLNGQLAYASYTCDWPVGSLAGVTRPLQLPGKDTDLMHLTGDARARYTNAQKLLQDRCAASFWCAINDLPEDTMLDQTGLGDARPIFVMASSDAYRDPTSGAIFGHCNGLCWTFVLTGEWLRRSITLTETCGLYINKIEYGEVHKGSEFISEVDATSAVASAMGNARAPDLQYAHERAAEEPGVKAVETTSWVAHCEGKGNVPSDAGSRNKQDVLRAISLSFGMQYNEHKLSTRSIKFMEDVLANTTDCAPALRQYNSGAPQPAAHSASTCPPDSPPSPPPERESFVQLSPCPSKTDKKQKPWPKASINLPAPTKMRSLKRKIGRRVSAIAQVLKRVLRKPDAGKATREAPSPPPSPPNSDRQSDSKPSPCPPPPATAPMMKLETATNVATAPKPAFTMSIATQPPALVGAPKAAAGTAVVVATNQRIFTTQGQAPANSRALVASARPTTASSARAASALDLADSMSMSQSPFAICPNRPEFLREVCVQTAATLSAGINKNTAKQDEWGYKWAAILCSKENLDTPVLRPKTLTPEQEKHEEWLMAYAVIFFGMHMGARRKRVLSTGNKPGFIDRAKPTSALLAVYAWRRVLRDAGCQLVCMKRASLHLKGLLTDFKKDYGQQSLDVFHQQPLRSTLIKACLDRLDNPDEYLSQWSGQERREMAMFITYAWLVGPRCDEICNPEDYVRQIWFVWCDPEGTALPEGAPILNGCLLRGMSAASKCDRFRMVWGNQRQWFRLNTEDKYCFALRYLRHTNTCTQECHHDTPLFSFDVDRKQPPKSQRLQHLLRALTVHVGGPDYNNITVHVFRVTAACNLVADDRDDATIQAICRWKTEASARYYGRMTPKMFADYLESATKASGHLRAMEPRPAIDLEDCVAELEHSYDHTQETNSATPPASPRKPPGDSPTTVTPAAKRKRADPVLAERRPEALRSLSRGNVSKDGATVDQRSAKRKSAKLTGTFYVGHPHKSIKAKRAHDDAFPALGKTVNLPDSLWPKFETATTKTQCMVEAYTNTATAGDDKDIVPSYVVYPCDKDKRVLSKHRTYYLLAVDIVNNAEEM